MRQRKDAGSGSEGRAQAPQPAKPLVLGYAHGQPFRPVDVRLHEPRRQKGAPGAAILAVVADDDLDASVADLGRDLAGAINGPLYLVRPVKVHATLPLQLSPQALDTVLGTIPIPFDPDQGSVEGDQTSMLLARHVGPTLVAEATARHCAGLVIGASPRGWRYDWRRRRLLHYLVRHAPCRVYIVEPAAGY